MSIPHHSPTSTGRRLRFGAMSSVLIAAATVSLVIANLLAARFPARLDVTEMREHRLSPRSQALIAGLTDEYEVVIAAPLKDRRLIDPRAVERAADVLDQFRLGAANARFKVTWIDTGSPAGMKAYDDLLKRLVSRDADRIKKQADAAASVISQSEAIATWLESLSPRLQAVRDAIPIESPNAATNKAYFEQRATESRVSARSLRELAGAAKAAMAAPTGQLPIPDAERALSPLRLALSDLHSGLSDIAENTAKFGSSEVAPPAARDAAKPVAADVAGQRDRVAMIREALDRMERLDLLRVAKALQSSSAALVIGPPERGMTGMELTRLLPPPSAASGADAGRNAEELIATALASLIQPTRPILVFIHGQPGRGLLRSPDFAGLMDRISMRGMDVAEWAAAVDAEQPVLSRLDPSGKRPVVYVVLSTDTSVNPGGKGMSGPDRAAKLGKIVSDLIEGGETVLLSLNPSTLPTFGQLDPMTAPLAGFGIKADTGRPILAERFTAGGRFVDAAQTLTAPNGQGPVANAIRGLPARLEWPIAITATSADGVRTWPLLVVDNKSAWAESQWLNYWQVRIADHELVPDKPSRDSERDDVKGPWTVALAAERGPPSDAQRLIVVGSNSWFMDRVALEQSVIDGRAAAAYPGNIELFEAAVYWLAGQDEMIAPSATARAVPLIRPLRGGTLLAIRWLTIAGLPGVVLMVGMVWRLLRG